MRTRDTPRARPARPRRWEGLGPRARGSGGRRGGRGVSRMVYPRLRRKGTRRGAPLRRRGRSPRSRVGRGAPRPVEIGAG